MGKLLKQGVGWRLGWNSEATQFKALAGTDDWAVELTEEEFSDFCRLLFQLVTTIEQMAEELADEEAIACEASSDLLWMQVSGYPQHHDLHLILLTGRQVEAYWPANVLPNLIKTAQVLQTFLDAKHVW
jgi:Domain of unknown function (DUF1818)